MTNFYYDKLRFSKEDLDNNLHRNVVGGMWDIMGKLQLNLCIKYGLTQKNFLLDFGCGALRGGVQLIKFLNKGNYYGYDVNKELIQIGIHYEIPKYELQTKILKENFLVGDNMAVDKFNKSFDFILAQSVFTHLPTNHFCFFLEKCYKILNKNGKILLSIYQCDEKEDLTAPKIFQSDINVVTTHLNDPFHYKLSQLKNIAGERWNITMLPDLHPRKQTFLLITKQ